MTTLGKEPVNVLKPATWAICRSARGKMPQMNPFKTQQGNLRILHQGLRLLKRKSGRRGTDVSSPGKQGEMPCSCLRIKPPAENTS